MSAPRTNLEKQRRRHWGPLLGMALVTLFAVAVIVYWLAEEMAQSDPPSPAGTASEPAPSALPADAIEPGMQIGEPGDTDAAPPREPVPRDSAPAPEAPATE